MFQGTEITVPTSKNLLLIKKELMPLYGAASNFLFKKVQLYKLLSDILTPTAMSSLWKKTKIQTQSSNSTDASCSSKC